MSSVVVSSGVTIEYEVRGDGDPLLLVMGLGAQLASWPDAFVDGLVERGFRVILFDNRDSGLSSGSTVPAPQVSSLVAASVARRFASAPYLLADMARDAIDLLDALGVERTHVVGASMGGMIAQEMAIGHGPRLRSLTSIMSTTGNRRVGQPTPAVLAKMARLARGSAATAVERQIEISRLTSGSSFDEAEVRRLSERVVRRAYSPEGTLRQTAAIMASPDRTAGLRRVRLPTLVVHGLEDTLVRPSGGLATTRAVPGARMVAFPDMGHNLPASRIGEMHDAIVANAGRAGLVSDAGWPPPAGR